MNTNEAIRVEHVSKRFRVYMDKGVDLKERVLFRNRRRYEERQVLRDISFTVSQGEAIGLVGENGCGKSTMLKMLSRIMYPDSGHVETNGRVSALIELGAGFHPDMSGRENIYTNAAIFGLSRAEIDSRLQDIIDFSELGTYIDNPVRTYSSGMYMRLAFSVAINVDADILLIDEILAVGDVAFQAKCFHKLREIKRRGTSIVIVSHSLAQIEQICERSYWIEGGRIRAEGDPFTVHQQYLQYMGERSGVLGQQEAPAPAEPAPAPEQEAAPAPQQEEVPPAPMPDAPAPEESRRWGSRDIVLDAVLLRDDQGRETTRLQAGKPFDIVLRWHVERPVEEVAFGIGVFRNDGLQCYGTNTDIDRFPVRLQGSSGETVFACSANGLLEGAYLLDAALHRPDGFAYDYYRECLSFTVYSVTKDVGVMRLEHAWRVDRTGGM